MMRKTLRPAGPECRWLLCLILLATATCGIAPALELEDPVVLSFGERPALASDGDSVYVAYVGSLGLDTLMLARSINGGRSFETPMPLRSYSSSVTGLYEPTVEASGTKVFVAWQERHSDGTYPLQLRVSEDNGATFSPALRVDGAAAASSGNAKTRLAYADERLYLMFLGTIDGKLDVLLRTSTDDGESFGDAIQLGVRDPGDPGVAHLSLAAVGSTVALAWELFGDEIWFRRSTDNGVTFGDAVGVASSESLPELAAHGDSVYLVSVVELASPQRYTVHLRASADGGASFGPGRVLATDIPRQPNPVAIAPPGQVAVAWESEEDDDSVIKINTSVDRGESFGQPVTLGAGRSPALTSQGLGLIAAWQDYEVTVRRSTPPRPIVFVPGVAGSVLYDLANEDEVWPDIGGISHENLSLHPADSPEQYDFVATEPISAAATFLGFEIEPIYGPFLDYLTGDLGLHQYEVFDESDTFRPERLTENGCDLTQTDEASAPDLFLFPYDWRRDNGLNADGLRDYIGCVRRIHPAAEVKIITHSMGSLLARRYILDQGGQHHVERMITIGAPWLGAPKMYNALETGDFAPHVLDSTVKHIIGSFEAAHQLIPSRIYTEALGIEMPLVEAGRDLDGDGTDDEVFTFDRLVEVTDDLYGQTFSPGSTGEAFHSNPGQDDWRSDTLDIDYFHIYGVQRAENSIAQVLATIETVCAIAAFFNCATIPSTALVLTRGDGTVPLESASRIRGPADLNDPDATLFAYESPSEDEDKGAEHNGLMRNPVVHGKVLEYLVAEPTDAAAAQRSHSKESLGANIPPSPKYRLVVVGAGSIVVADETGNELHLYPDLTLGEIPGGASFRLGDGISMVTLPTNPARSFSIGLVAGTGPMAIELIAGTEGNTTGAVRFPDLDLIAGRAAMLTVAGATISDLDYDSTGDGNFDTTIPATVRVSGAEAADTEPPAITVEKAPSVSSLGPVNVTIYASDLVSGPVITYYSLDGSRFQEVIGQLEIDVGQYDSLWIFADDAVGNRASRIVSLIDPNLIFADGFESSDWDAWSTSKP